MPRLYREAPLNGIWEGTARLRQSEDGIMARYLCHDEPELLSFEADVLDSRPGAVRLSRSAFYPGRGGQLPDRGTLEWQGGKVDVAGFEEQAGRVWHLLAEPIEVSGAVSCEVDRDFRFLMQQLHTDLHIVNALVFQAFDGALVTGVQMAADGTARDRFRPAGCRQSAPPRPGARDQRCHRVRCGSGRSRTRGVTTGGFASSSSTKMTRNDG